MKNAHKKTMTSLIALFLTITIAAPLIALPTVNAQILSTYAWLSVGPNPAGVGQRMGITMWVDKFPPARSYPYPFFFEGFKLEVTKPDGKTQILGPFTSDWVSMYTVYYVPDQVGTYSFQFFCPEQWINGTGSGGVYYAYHYGASKSAKVNATVQEEQLEWLLSAALPTEYWTRPITAENKEWYTIAGNWLGVGSGPRNASGVQASFNPYTKAPNSAHIAWTKPLTFGGLIGGEYGRDISYYSGSPYYYMWTPPVVISGRLYYNTPLASHTQWMGVNCVDLRTGEEIWWKNYTITQGQIYYYNSYQQAGALAYLWSISGTTWRMYDAFTGDQILTIANARTGTVTNGPTGEILVYVLDATRNWLAMWNSSKCIIDSYYTTGVQYWAPPVGKTIDWKLGVQWNITVPNVPGQAIRAVTSDVILATTPQDDTIDPTWQADIAYDAETGKLLWGPINRTIAEGYQGTGFQQAMGNGVYTDYRLSSGQWHGYDYYTGKQLWVSEPYTYAWDSAPRTSIVAYGKLYAGQRGGVFNYDLKTGKVLWEWHPPSAGLEMVEPTWPLETRGLVIADGKVFVSSGESHPRELYRGMRLYVLSAETGEELWSVAGWYSQPRASNIAVDGYFVTRNHYDQQLYCYGKGSVATTVIASPKIIADGASVLIEGTVMDVSPGTESDALTLRFPNGVPAMSDADMSDWMEYVYMQKAKPTNATGVEVTLNVIDANGNNRNIGTTTSDANGFYSFDWTPDIEGKYTVVANFQGSESYWPSQAETAFVVNVAPPQPTEQPAIALPPTEMYMLGIGAAIIIAVAIVGALILMAVKKRP